MKQYYESYMREVPCQACNGRRLRPEVLAVTVDGESIADVCDMPVERGLAWINGLKLEGAAATIAGEVVKEIRARLGFLNDVGLNYLTLSRAAKTLSGGEAQRIRLATQIGSGLVGVMYVLDEPSIGLHQRDNARLIETLHHLRDLGNTLIVVEHDQETIERADWVVDIGPGAGEHGGEVIYSGPAKRLIEAPRSVTGDTSRPTEHRSAGRAAQAACHEAPSRGGGKGEQSEEHHRRFPPWRDDCGHRRLRLRQIDPGEHDPLPGARRQAQRRAHRAGQAHARRGP